MKGSVSFGGSELHPFRLAWCSALAAFNKAGCVGWCGVLLVFGGDIGVIVGFSVVSFPTYCMRVGYPHDFHLHIFAMAAMVSEVVVGFGGFQIGANLLLDDGCGDCVLCELAGVDKSAYCRLVSVYP